MTTDVDSQVLTKLNELVDLLKTKVAEKEAPKEVPVPTPKETPAVCNSTCPFKKLLSEKDFKLCAQEWKKNASELVYVTNVHIWLE